MSNGLKGIFELQRVFSKYFNVKSNMSFEDKEKHTKDYILALLDECHEVLRETNWKHWKTTKKPVNIDKVKEEIIDVFIFLIDLCIVWDIDDKELIDIANKKIKNNFDRYYNANTKK